MEKDGLVIIGVTDEPPSLVDEWILKTKATYPIVSTKGGELEAFLGVKAFPTAAVLTPDGKVSWIDHFGYEGPLEAALEGAQGGALYPKDFDGVKKRIVAQDYSGAYGDLLKMLEKGKLSEEAKGVADQFKSYLEGEGQRGLDSAREALEAGLVYRALAHAEAVAEAKPPFPASAGSLELVQELQALPAFKDEMKGGGLHGKALEAEDEYEFVDAFELYKKILKKYPDTKIAMAADKAAKEILDKGMAGFKRTCTDCRKKKKACEKHYEDLEL